MLGRKPDREGGRHNVITCEGNTPSLTVGLLPRLPNHAPECQAAGCVNLPRVLDTEEVRQFAIIVAIVNNKVGELTRLE